MSRVRIAEDEQRLKRLNQVEGWLSRAETLINDADQLIFQSSQHVDNLCMGGCCSTHPRSSIKFGKQIAKKLQEVKDQKENGDFSDVASKPPPPSSTERPSEPTVGLEFYLNKSLDEKAEDIFKVLCKKKFALLLDDIWEWFDLTRAGIRIPTQENGSKVIFTTRRVDVCCQMQPNMDNNIGVECLPPGEAFKLFEKKVGSETLRMHPDICKLAEAVVEECAGLPLALITIGRAMASKKTLREWEYV
ncbi:hypothetical protein PVK06_000186 [Gossypium arboreum]|uniref:NB-ARC domain-containing protein n=1 Tax=Gossypium arboreum TaxID=29729 RepID=A0ABR0QXM7_GOSAR|nr:hypothetical protein PVK06_000186 [Gossypium arboreum]